MSDHHKHGHTAELEPEVEDLDVDTDEELEDVEITDDEASDKPAKAEKAPAAPKRGDLPEGWVTPVAFAKHMTENQLHYDKDGNVAELKPQVVYSYIKNAPAANPFPHSESGKLLEIEDTNGVKRGAFPLADGIEWWENRRKRAQERKENAAAKAAKKATPANKPVAGPLGEDEDLEEAVEAE